MVPWWLGGLSMKRVCLGKIVSPHGVKGLVKILPYGDDVSLLERSGPLFTSEEAADTLSLTLKNPHGKYWLAAVENINDRSAAEKLNGTDLYIRADLRPATDEGEFYYDDLIGLKALDEAGHKIGVIIAVENFGAGDLLEIKPKTGESYYVPFNDDFVPAVDIESGSVTIIPPEYLESKKT